MNEEKFRNEYKRAFSSIHADHDFKVSLEENTMTKKTWNKGFAAICTAAVIAFAGTTAYAQDAGGIQRKMQIWINGDQTTATVDFSDNGTYIIHDEAGNEVGGGGGIAIGKLGQKDRPLTAEEMEESLADDITLDNKNGDYILHWHNKSVDITDSFGEDGYAYITLTDQGKVKYVTISKDGSYATGTNKYPVPGKDFN